MIFETLCTQEAGNSLQLLVFHVEIIAFYLQLSVFSFQLFLLRYSTLISHHNISFQLNDYDINF